MASYTIILETWKGSALPTAHLTESYCGQTVKVCHHQNNAMILAPIFTDSALRRF